ncbi:MAG TPA: NAD(P)/FAD-dependent oxidoreductase [Candidatus Limiplasma sp.]|nr:NAD(P)/FAD-dependent oxidoreductase [Candidatus Limiplasma sp.]HRX09432.1 NAD(P)/FAD-dependent oxidoreductase [Candidatus Limiplasma sp.]
MKQKIVIIGGGVIGCAVARELSAYDADILLVERAIDVSEGASKANSGLAHAGFDNKPGSNKAKFNIQGSKMLEALCRELSVPYKRNGAMVLAFDDTQTAVLHELLQQGMVNGVDGMEIIGRDRILALEPHTNPRVVAALHVKSAASVSPYELTYALADHAKVNGVDFQFNTEVRTIKRDLNRFILTTCCGDIPADIVINCAGVGADMLHNQISERKVTITPRKGEYYLLDREVKPMFTHTMFQTPTKMGKGILITPTLHNGLLLGPTATDITDGTDVSTTAEALRQVREITSLTWPQENLKTVITTFSGIRAHEAGGDFIIGAVEGAPGAYEAIGIESPGLSSSPAIGQYLAELIAEQHDLRRKGTRVPPPKYLPPFESMTVEEKAKAYANDPEYGAVVCRCEHITEAEIRAAIRRPVGATTVDGVKRRTRAGMGRCQGGFCSPRVMEILSEELHLRLNQVTKSGGNSRILLARIEDAAAEGDDRHA